MNPMQLLAVIFLSLLIAACGGPQHKKMVDPDFSEKSLKKLHSHYVIHKTKNSSANLHAVSISDTKSYPVVMLHGTPGKWSTFSFVLGNTKLQASNHLISLDRLDWGESLNSDPKKQSPSFDDQVDAIAAMIKNITNEPVILVGHSLGASLAPSVAIKHPDLVAGMILVAGTVDPNLGDPRWYNKIAKWKVVQWFLPKSLVFSNREIYTLKPGLIAAKPHWHKLNIPVAVIQGQKDKLVDPENVQFVEKQYATRQELLDIVILEKSGHFIPWEHTSEIVKAIQRMTGKIEQKNTRSQ